MKVANVSGIIESYAGVPSDSVAVGAAYFLRPSGQLYFRNTVVATGVAKAAGDWDNNYYFVTYVTSAGAVYRYGAGDASQAGKTWGPIQYSGIPSLSYPTPLGSGFSLTGSGELFSANTKIASGVFSAFVQGRFYENEVCYFNDASGAKVANIGGVIEAYAGLPADAVAVGAAYFLRPSGQLYFRNNVIATGVAKAMGDWDNNYYFVTYVTSAGAVYRYGVGDRSDAGKTWGPIQWTAVPGSSTPVGHAFVLAPSGDLYYGNDKIASNISSASGWALNTWKGQASLIAKDGTTRMFLDDGSRSFTNLTTNFAGATALVAGYFLKADGTLFYQDSQVATGVQAAQGNIKDAAKASIVLKNGVVEQATGTSLSAPYPAVPVKPSPVGHAFVLAPSGDLYYANDKIASNISSASGWTLNTWKGQASMIAKDGTARMFLDDGSRTFTNLTTNFAGATALVGGYFFTSDGKVFYQDTQVATGVQAAQGNIKDAAKASIVLSNGLAEQANGSSVVATFAVIANRPKAVGGGFCLTPGGNLYYGSSQVLSSVASAVGWGAAGTPICSALGTDGKVRKIQWSNGSASTTTLSTDFSGALVLGGGYILAASGALYLGDTAVETQAITAQGTQGSTSIASYTKYAC
ncbi:hypothetical protein [Microbacterium testaceum]|uniref:hypothetical protein n=1 Tax=Microbacterium testaceum TaxID=2033 RepID=UPI000AB79881|nr:hypothetical protein [Microbacterium testaceum]